MMVKLINNSQNARYQGPIVLSPHHVAYRRVVFDRLEYAKGPSQPGYYIDA
jgi:hypothetical protein